MKNWIIEVAGYGVPGLVVAGVVYVVARLIERGFSLRVPPDRR
jgi:hypothetical protein